MMHKTARPEVVMMTGASAGIERATAWKFAREGACIGLYAVEEFTKFIRMELLQDNSRILVSMVPRTAVNTPSFHTTSLAVPLGRLLSFVLSGLLGGVLHALPVFGKLKNTLDAIPFRTY